MEPWVVDEPSTPAEWRAEIARLRAERDEAVAKLRVVERQAATALLAAADELMRIRMESLWGEVRGAIRAAEEKLRKQIGRL